MPVTKTPRSQGRRMPSRGGRDPSFRAACIWSPMGDQNHGHVFATVEKAWNPRHLPHVTRDVPGVFVTTTVPGAPPVTNPSPRVAPSSTIPAARPNPRPSPHDPAFSEAATACQGRLRKGRVPSASCGRRHELHSSAMETPRTSYFPRRPLALRPLPRRHLMLRASSAQLSHASCAFRLTRNVDGPKTHLYDGFSARQHSGAGEGCRRCGVPGGSRDEPPHFPTKPSRPGRLIAVTASQDRDETPRTF